MMKGPVEINKELIQKLYHIVSVKTTDAIKIDKIRTLMSICTG